MINSKMIYVGTLITADSTKEDIINMMVGRVIYEDPKEHSMVAPLSLIHILVSVRKSSRK